jgi:hypothetical protein
LVTHQSSPSRKTIKMTNVLSGGWEKSLKGREAVGILSATQYIIQPSNYHWLICFDNIQIQQKVSGNDDPG